VAVNTYDHVSLLDLAHTLRVWADARTLVTKEAPAFARSVRFKACSPSRKASNTLRTREHVYCLFVDGVVTYASQGEITGLLDRTRDRGDFEVTAKFKRTGQTGLEVAFYAYWAPGIDMPIAELFRDQGVKRCTFTQWLDSRTVVGVLPAERGLVPFSLTREKLIRRVANELEASHPEGMEVPPHAREASRATRYLLGHVVAGLPLPYLLLLKDAQELLQIGQRYFSAETAT